jgi:hypothetical protein
MGMYTEIYARGTLKRNTPQEVIDLLQIMAGEDLILDNLTLPDHELFKTERWDVLGCGASAYFPCTTSKMEVSDYSHQWSFMFHANLKNYGREIEKFFDWVDQYVEGSEGEFLGHEIYEETEPGQAPRNYFKKASNW